jgi:hypothetical protein
MRLCKICNDEEAGLSDIGPKCRRRVKPYSGDTPSYYGWKSRGRKPKELPPAPEEIAAAFGEVGS